MGVGRQEREKGGKNGWKMLGYEGLDKRSFLTWRKKANFLGSSFLLSFSYMQKTPTYYFLTYSTCPLLIFTTSFGMPFFRLDGGTPADALAPS